MEGRSSGLEARRGRKGSEEGMKESSESRKFRSGGDEYKNLGVNLERFVKLFQVT